MCPAMEADVGLLIKNGFHLIPIQPTTASTHHFFQHGPEKKETISLCSPDQVNCSCQVGRQEAAHPYSNEIHGTKWKRNCSKDVSRGEGKLSCSTILPHLAHFSEKQKQSSSRTVLEKLLWKKSAILSFGEGGERGGGGVKHSTIIIISYCNLCRVKD